VAGNKYDKGFREYLRDVGSKIRSLRDEQGLTTEQAAERAGMSAGYWGICERGSKQPSLQSLFHFAQALGVDVADLVAVGPAAPGVVAKSRHRQLDQMLEAATAVQTRAILACAKAILSLSDQPDPAGGSARKSGATRR
jgi:transcriptional regulator with XRE-family HTH domain